MEYDLPALAAAFAFAILGFWMRWMSPLGGAIFLAALAAICLGLWLWLGRVGGGNPGQAFLLYDVLLPGLGGAVPGVTLAWRQRRG